MKNWFNMEGLLLNKIRHMHFVCQPSVFYAQCVLGLRMAMDGTQPEIRHMHFVCQPSVFYAQCVLGLRMAMDGTQPESLSYFDTFPCI